MAHLNITIDMPDKYVSAIISALLDEEATAPPEARRRHLTVAAQSCCAARLPLPLSLIRSRFRSL